MVAAEKAYSLRQKNPPLQRNIEAAPKKLAAQLQRSQQTQSKPGADGADSGEPDALAEKLALRFSKN